MSSKAEEEARSRTVRQVAEVPLAGTDPIRVFSRACRAGQILPDVNLTRNVSV